jgi:hypothetical protein
LLSRISLGLGYHPWQRPITAVFLGTGRSLYNTTCCMKGSKANDKIVSRAPIEAISLTVSVSGHGSSGKRHLSIPYMYFQKHGESTQRSPTGVVESRDVLKLALGTLKPQPFVLADCFSNRQ